MKVRIIVDCSDGSKDRWLPADVAYDLYKQNELAWDVTNRSYTLVKTNHFTKKIMEAFTKY